MGAIAATEVADPADYLGGEASFTATMAGGENRQRRQPDRRTSRGGGVGGKVVAIETSEVADPAGNREEVAALGEKGGRGRNRRSGQIGRPPGRGAGYCSGGGRAREAAEVAEPADARATGRRCMCSRAMSKPPKSLPRPAARTEKRRGA